jgi:hypothetical protein
MTDTTESQSGDPVEDTRAHNKNLIFDVLAEAGIHKLTVGFDGYGDSGQIGEVEAWSTDQTWRTGDDRIPVPSSRKVQLASPVSGNPPVEMTLQEAIETLAYDYLEETHMGWENNDGAFGTFVFDVPDRSITLEHNERYTEVATSTHEF